MKLSQQVLYAIDDAGAGKFDAALLHACIAIDTTAKRLYPSERKVGVRYMACLRDYYWIIEPMIGAGLDLIETRLSNVHLGKNHSPISLTLFMKYSVALTRMETRCQRLFQ
jgi:hypothetical protein